MLFRKTGQFNDFYLVSSLADKMDKKSYLSGRGAGWKRGGGMETEGGMKTERSNT